MVEVPPRPARLAAAEAERLPEEIEQAIDAFDYAVETCAKEGHPEFVVAIDQKRSILTATILTRLTAAEAARDAAVARAERLEGALKGILKPFPAVIGSSEDMLEDWVSAVSRFRGVSGKEG